MFFFASQLRSVLSPQRSIDRPRPPPFCRRDQPPRLANPFPSGPSRHDVTESRPIQTHTIPRVARPPAMTVCKFYQQGNCKFGSASPSPSRSPASPIDLDSLQTAVASSIPSATSRIRTASAPWPQGDRQQQAALTTTRYSVRCARGLCPPNG